MIIVVVVLALRGIDHFRGLGLVLSFTQSRVDVVLISPVTFHRTILTLLSLKNELLVD